MTEKIRILFLSANPWTTSRILVDEEAREIFEKLQEGPDRDKFELHRHSATRPIDLQRLLMTHEPQIVHFSGHGSKQQKIILGGKPGRGKQVDRDGLVQMFALYKDLVRLVVLNACFTSTQAQSLSEVIDYSVGAGRGIGDKEGVAFAGAFYRALGFGKSTRTAFESAKAELALTRMPRTRGLHLFVRNGVNENDAFPKSDNDLGSEALDSGNCGLDQFTDKSSDYDILQSESALHHEQKSEPGIPISEGSTTGASELVFEKDQNSNLTLRQLSIPTESRMTVQGLMRLGEKLSHSAVAGLRKVNRAKLTHTNSIHDEIEQWSSESRLRASVTMTINLFGVALGDSKSSSQTRSPRKKQAGRTGTRFANKRLGRRKRSDSDSSA